jgi:hypothetical protein
MIAHSCQWEPERPAMTPSAAQLPAKNERQGLLALPFSISGVPGDSGVIAVPRSARHGIVFKPANHPDSVVRRPRGCFLLCSEQLQNTAGERRERGSRTSEKDPGYATDRSDVKQSAEECFRFSRASFNSSIPNGLSRQASAPAFPSLCKADGLPLMPMT